MSSVESMGMSGITRLALTSAVKPAGSAKIQDAAQQFEALLIGQILHSAHDSDGGWLGTGDDSAGSCASDFAEEQLASTIAKQGGFGLAQLISQAIQTQK